MAEATTKVTISRIFQFPKGAWVENLAVRPNGKLLLVRYDVAEIYELDAHAENPTPRLLHQWADGAKSVTGCAETSPDVFAVVVLTPQSKSPKTTKFALWGLDFSTGGEDPIVAMLAADIPNAGLLNGLAPLSSTAVLAADTKNGVVHRIDLRTGASSVVIKDSTMRLLGLGINGVRIRGNTLYFTNTAKGLFAKVPIDESSGETTGPVEILAKTGIIGDLTGIDDFALGHAENEAFIVNFVQNKLLKVDGTGRVTVLAGSVLSQSIPGPCSAQFGRTETDESVLYVTTSGNAILPLPGARLGGGGQVIAVKLEL
jgi:hypothetical protein